MLGGRPVLPTMPNATYTSGVEHSPVLLTEVSHLLFAAGIFLLTFTLSLVIFGVLVVALPADYFSPQRRGLLADQPPLVRWLGIIGKNLLGLVLIIVGAILSIPGVPGQGLLTIAVGVVLLDIPGKHQLVRAVVRRPGVQRNMNRFRSWFGRPPLVE